MKEEWKYIKDYPNYMVSNLGNVKSLNYRRTGKEHLLKQTTNNDGYKLVVLHNDNGNKTITVHKLVASTFLNKYGHNDVVLVRLFSVDYNVAGFLKSWLCKHLNKACDKSLIAL